MRIIVLIIVAVVGYILPRELAIEQALADLFKNSKVAGYEPMMIYGFYTLLIAGIVAGSSPDKQIVLAWGDLDKASIRKLNERLVELDSVDTQKLVDKVAAIKSVYNEAKLFQDSGKISAIVNGLKPLTNLDTDNIVEKAHAIRDGLTAISNINADDIDSDDFEKDMKVVTDVFDTLNTVSEDYDLDELKERAEALASAVTDIRKLTKDV